MRIYIDMDGVLTDFKLGCKLQGLDQKQMNAPDKHVDYGQLPIMFGAVGAVAALEAMGHELFIASTPPWRQPKAWMDKRLWVEEYFPSLKRKVVLTHRKDLLKGDILIDDSHYRGQPDFEGTWIHFGGKIDWTETLNIIKNKLTHDKE